MESYYTLPLLSGAYVIGTTSTEEKAAKAKACGANEVILYSKKDFVQEVNSLTYGGGVNVVYDGVGKATFGKGKYNRKLPGISVKRYKAMAIRLFRVFVNVDRPVINVRLTLNIVSISAIRLPNTSLNSVKKKKRCQRSLRTRIKMLGVRIGKLKTRKTKEN